MSIKSEQCLYVCVQVESKYWTNRVHKKQYANDLSGEDRLEACDGVGVWLGLPPHPQQQLQLLPIPGPRTPGTTSPLPGKISLLLLLLYRVSEKAAPCSVPMSPVAINV